MNQEKQLITDPAVSAQRPHKYLGVFGMIWVTILLIGIFTAVKTFSVGSVVFSVAILAYPFTYLFADIFTEVYGYRVTRKIVWTGFGCILLASAIAYIYSLVPSTSSFTDNDAFNLIFRSSPIIAVASIIAFFSGEITNSFVVAKVKLWTGESHKWMRWISSTFLGQIVDNGIFFTAAFLAAGWYTPAELFPLVMSSVLFCTIWETLALPITYKVIAFIKLKEGVDTYDKGTNFNPFNLRQ
ncbi:MAG: queuosine precursor transporter [Patescibacteria group bacterium]